MGVVFRQSLKATIVTFTGALLGALINYFYPFVITNKTELGLITNIVYAATLAHTFVLMGVLSTIMTYTQRYPVHDSRRKVLFTLSVVVTLFVSTIFTILFLLFKQHIVPLYKVEDQTYVSTYYILVPVITILLAIFFIFEYYMVSQVKVAIPVFLREVVLRICQIGLIALLYFDVISFHAFVIGTALTYIVPLVAIAIITSKVEGFGISFDVKAFTKAEYKDLIHFSWYHLLLGASLNILGYIDAMMLGPLAPNGIESLAPYRIAIFIATILYLPYRGMTNASFPILNEAYINKDMPKLKSLFHRAGVNIQIAAFAMILLIGLNLDNVVAILPEGYELVKPLVWIMMLGKLVDMCTGLNNELISISKHYKFNYRLALLLLIGVYIFDRMYIPVYGSLGAAWVTAIALVAFNIIKVIFLWYKFKLHPFNKNLARVLIVAAVAAAAGYFFPQLSNPIVDAIVRSSIIAVVYLGMLLLIKPSADLNEFLQNIKEKKRLF